jgi:RNA polymerase sigma-70 factor (ECF subfamily)
MSGHATADADAHVSDAEDVARFREDPELFTDVHDRYFRDIHGYVAGRLGTQAADDVTAETFCVAFGQRARFDPERGNLRAWLFGIATNLIARHRRNEARRYKALARAVPEPDAGSHENRVVTAIAARPQLAKALASLSRGERDAVLLVALGQLSYEEVAEALSISRGTVGSRLSRARKKLHNAIDQEALNG